MFKNIGNKIKGLAKVFYWIGVVVYSLAGVGAAIAAIATSDGEIVIILASLIGGAACVGLGILISWLSTMMLYAYGELVQQTIETAKGVKTLTYMMHNLLERQNNSADQAAAAPLVEDIAKIVEQQAEEPIAVAQPEEAKVEEPIAAPKVEEVKAAPAAPKNTFCHQCGTVLEPGSAFCTNCGTKLA